MHSKLLAVTCAAVALVVGPIVTADAKTQGNFAILFDKLPALTGPTSQQTADLAQRMLDPNADSENNCPVGTPSPANGPECTASGYTYFGQFIDHDLTLDTSPPPTGPVNPTTLTNSRTLALDLDSVYGDGPTAQPQFYDGARFKLPLNVNGVRDLPRNADGSAIINEPRNDENQIISQIEIAMMSVHNRFVDMGMTFDQARLQTVLHYQWAVVHDFLPHTLDPTYADIAALKLSNPLVQVVAHAPDTTMVEFSVAAYRFGHSQVRRAYEVNDNSGKVQVFSLTAPDLRGGRPLTAARQIDWGNFFHELTDANDVVHVNVGRRIDALISSSLFVLPIPGAEATGSNVLAFRNMTRAQAYGMPSGQSIAAALGIPVVAMNLGPGFETQAPLWYYVLAESSVVEQGRVVGPVGSAIIAATFLGALSKGAPSIFVGNDKKFVPLAAVSGPDNVLTLSDLVAFAGTSV